MKSFLQSWRKKPVNDTSLFETPIYKATTSDPFKRSLIKLASLILAVLIFLIWYGSPALRVSYTWNGKAYSPYYYRCTYLSLLTGFEPNEFPRRGDGRCPLVTGINIPSLHEPLQALGKHFNKTHQELFH